MSIAKIMLHFRKIDYTRLGTMLIKLLVKM